MCKYCKNGECILRDGIADDCTCAGDISEIIECGYVDYDYDNGGIIYAEND